MDLFFSFVWTLIGVFSIIEGILLGIKVYRNFRSYLSSRQKRNFRRATTFRKFDNAIDVAITKVTKDLVVYNIVPYTFRHITGQALVFNRTVEHDHHTEETLRELGMTPKQTSAIMQWLKEAAENW